MIMKALSLIPLLISLIFISCGSDSKPAATTNDTTNTIAASLETAKSELKSALPNPQASSEMALLQDKGFYALELDEHTNYGEDMNYLALPGGCGRGDEETEWAENSPRDYLYSAMDPDYGCTEDGEVVSREDEPGEFGPTVFARFEEELFVIETVQNLVSMRNNVIIPDTYTDVIEVEGFNARLTLEVVDYDDNNQFDSKMIAKGTDPDDEDMVFIYSTLFVKFSNGITRLALFDDCRDMESLGCDEEGKQPGVSWSYFSYDSNNGKLVYEFGTLSEEEFVELQRVFRDADTDETTLAHYVSVNVEKVALVFGAEGANSSQLSASLYLEGEDPGSNVYSGEVCIDAEDLSLVDGTTGLCSGSRDDLDAEKSKTEQGLVWEKAADLIELLFGDELEKVGEYFSDFSSDDVIDFYSTL